MASVCPTNKLIDENKIWKKWR